MMKDDWTTSPGNFNSPRPRAAPRAGIVAPARQSFAAVTQPGAAARPVPPSHPDTRYGAAPSGNDVYATRSRTVAAGAAQGAIAGGARRATVSGGKDTRRARRGCAAPGRARQAPRPRPRSRDGAINGNFTLSRAPRRAPRANRQRHAVGARRLPRHHLVCSRLPGLVPGTAARDRTCRHRGPFLVRPAAAQIFSAPRTFTALRAKPARVGALPRRGGETMPQASADAPDLPGTNVVLFKPRRAA